MNTEKLKKKVLELPRIDRIRLAHDLWDSFFLGNTQLNISQIRFLQRRLTQYLDDGASFMSPNEIRMKLRKLKAQLKKRSAAQKVKV